MKAMMKLLEEVSLLWSHQICSTHFIQLALALMLVPLALILSGKISAMRVQETGPQPYCCSFQYCL
jgi:hypothetical protein